MDDILKLETVSAYNDWMGVETFHPLVTVFDFEKATHPAYTGRLRMGFYFISLKMFKGGNLQYGRQSYDFQEGSLIAVAPGQILGIDNKPDVAHKGWALAFHPDFIHGTPLAQKLKNYSFFSYEVNEALHLSEQERQIVLDILAKIDYEQRHPIDRHSQTLITEYIGLLLDYCVRFYERQFITRKVINNDILTRFEQLLDVYFKSQLPQEKGLPSVKYCADELHLSTNYFGDLIKKETGMNVQDHIQLRVIDMAKELIMDGSRTVSEIAYQLGFQYPHYFSRIFKKHVGVSPNEYRSKGMA